MHNFCTLFDKNYAHRGLALYNSCKLHCNSDFKMWILCLDDTAKEILKRLNLGQAIILTIEDLNDRELSSLVGKRSNASFAWTCKQSLINFILPSIGEDEILAYLDSDTFLFYQIEKLYSSFRGKSLIITPHRFPKKEKDKESLVGRFNAGVIFFRKDKTAFECLRKWRSQCLEWCGDRLDNGRLGDQMYLNEWPNLYPNVLVLNHDGVNAGSWNISDKKIRKKDGLICIDHDLLILFHFHSFRTYSDKNKTIYPYPVSMGPKIIFNPYVEALRQALLEIRGTGIEYMPKLDPKPGFVRLWKQRIMKRLL